jgi:hypothetical protein
MKSDLIDAITSPKSDPEFGRKFAITVACTAGAVVVLPAVVLAGYLAQTIKHATSGKKGLPEWTNFAELAVQGGVSFLAGLYLLPGALLLAIGYLPGIKGGQGFFSVSTMLSNFISFGALLVALGGLAFTVTGIHSYLFSRQIGDIFNISKTTTKLRAHMTELGMLLAFVGVVAAGLSIVNALLGWPGAILSLLGGAFMNLVLAYGTGSVYGVEGPAADEAPALEAAPDVIEMSLPQTAEVVLPEEEAWKPK